MRRALVLILLAACNGEHESELRFPAAENTINVLPLVAPSAPAGLPEAVLTLSPLE